MKLGEYVTTIPTIGFNVETVEYENIDVTIRDVARTRYVCSGVTTIRTCRATSSPSTPTIETASRAHTRTRDSKTEESDELTAELEKLTADIQQIVAKKNEDYMEPMAQDSAAKEVTVFAKKSKSNVVMTVMDMPLKDPDE